jgi:hypothetical protein
MVQKYRRADRGLLGDGSDTALRLRQTHTSSRMAMFSKKVAWFPVPEGVIAPVLTHVRQQIVAVREVVFLTEVFLTGLARGIQACKYPRGQNKCAPSCGSRPRNRPQRHHGVIVALVAPRA